jgi:hypothetical protein
MSEMSFWSLFAVGVLATWRVAHLVAREDGPGDLVFRLRLAAGQGLLAQAMDCFHCVALWVAAPVALVLADSMATWLIAWLGLAGAASLAERLVAAHEPSTKGALDHDLLRTETGGDRPHGITQA